MWLSAGAQGVSAAPSVSVCEMPRPMEWDGAAGCGKAENLLLHPGSQHGPVLAEALGWKQPRGTGVNE